MSGYNSYQMICYVCFLLETGFNPAELMFGIKLRDNLPSTLVGHPLEKKDFFEREEKYQLKYKRQFDKRHRASGLSELELGCMVWITDLRRHGRVVRKLKEPRSYLVETDKRTIRRNCIHLVPAPYFGVDISTDHSSAKDSDTLPLVEKVPVSSPQRSDSKDGPGSATRYERPIKKPCRYQTF